MLNILVSGLMKRSVVLNMLQWLSKRFPLVLVFFFATLAYLIVNAGNYFVWHLFNLFLIIARALGTRLLALSFKDRLDAF